MYLTKRRTQRQFPQHTLQGKAHFQKYIKIPSNINLGHIKPIHIYFKGKSINRDYVKTYFFSSFDMKGYFRCHGSLYIFG